jgi:hypothetical protein
MALDVARGIGALCPPVPLPVISTVQIAWEITYTPTAFSRWKCCSPAKGSGTFRQYDMISGIVTFLVASDLMLTAGEAQR